MHTVSAYNRKVTVADDAPCTGNLQAQVTLQAPGQAAVSFSVTLNNGGSPPLSKVYLPTVLRPDGASAQALPQADSAPRRYVLAIGVADYQNLSAPATFELFRSGKWPDQLSFPGADSVAFSGEFDDICSSPLSQAPNGLVSVCLRRRVIDLRNSAATRENISFAINQYLPAQISADQDPAAPPEPPAEVVIYFSGHGAQMTDLSQSAEPDGMVELIAPYDIYVNPAVGFVNAITDDELSQWLVALAGHPVGMILDSCYSGGMQVSDPDHVLLTASAEDQVSWETSLLEHGVFTSFALQAMAEPANDLNGDSWISLAELHQAVAPMVHAYIIQNVPVYQREGQDQDPQLIRTTGGDVRLVQLP